MTFLGVASLLFDDGESAAYVGRGHGLAEDQIRVVEPGEPMTCGAFTITEIESRHCPPDRSRA